MFKKLALLVTVLILFNLANALDVQKYNAEFNLVDDKAVVDIEMVFDEPKTGILQIELPEDYSGLSVYVDNKSSYVMDNNFLSLVLDNSTNVNFNYVTREFVDKTNFLMNLEFAFNVEDLEIELVLPEKATLKKPMKKGDLTSGSIYPKPDEATTDGLSLTFFWRRSNLKEGDEISIFTQIEPEKSYLWVFIFISLVILSLLVLLFRKPKKEYIREKPEKEIIVRKEDMVEKHLKSDESQVVNILKLKEGSCEQGTLRIATGFSKATLSRLLKELEERKIIYKEKRGKKNLVFLKKE